MTSLTIAIDDETFQRAQDRATERGTSVDLLLKAYVEELAGASGSYRRAIRSLLERSERVHSGRGDRTWTRDDLHERDA